MGIEVNTIITLENNEQYIVLSETMYKARKYFLVMGIDQDKNINSSDVAIFEEEMEGLDIFVSKITDPELMVTLKELLKTIE